MNYITNQIVQLVSSHEPDASGETMIMINGFEDLRLYNQIARLIAYAYKLRPLSVDIKLAGKKWAALQGSSDTTTEQSMIQNGWVADKESVTYYRNLHHSNILVLMGTEDEEDTGGLKNCYTITPESLLKNLSSNYSSVLVGCFNFSLSDADIECINKMYRCLFEFVAPDICKLSACADGWKDCFDSIEDFIFEYFQSLPDWGLPRRTLKVLTRKQIEKKGNFLRPEYQFISRKLFNRVSKAQYKNFEKKLAKYDEEGENYSSSWTEWNTQGFDSYEDFSQVLLAFVRGEEIPANKRRLLKLDYSIVDEILNIKLPKVPKTVVHEISLTGEPLQAFLSAFLTILKAGKGYKIDSISRVEFEFTQAEIVTGFTDADDLEKQEQLRNVWENICVHVSGVLEFIDLPDWSFNGESVSIGCSNEGFFDISNVAENIEGIVKTASGTNTLSKIKFLVRCLDADGHIISYCDSPKDKEEDLELRFCWKFRNESGWLYDFSDIVRQDFSKCVGSKVIPIGVLKKIHTAMVLKSEEEFFDLYEEADIDYSFNLMDFIKDKTQNAKSGSSLLIYRVLFEELAEKFCIMIKRLAEKGFYRCIGSESVNAFIKAYNKLAVQLLKDSHPENQLWILDAFIHAFNLEENTTFLKEDEDTECSIVPPWHPAALQKLCDQKRFIVDGLYDAWSLYDFSSKKLNIEETIADLYRTTEIQSAVDLFPAASADYLGIMGTYGAYSVYGNSNKTNEIKTRVRDLIKKEAIYDDEFNKSELTRMNDDAQMIYDVLKDYIKALPSAKYSMSLVFINPTELQPIIAAVYHYTDELRKTNTEQIINIKMTILVKPENKGGRNYLAYWMDDYFAQESNIYIRTYLNEWTSKSELDRLLNPNNDIVFNMDLLHVNTFSFIPNYDTYTSLASDCRFPVVYKPSPLSKTSKKRRIELSQPQFTAAFNHTQLVRYRRNSETIPVTQYIAVRESSLDKETQSIINLLHRKSYWVVCVDRVMDGALLKGDSGNEYSIIGFSTGKGTYGQYNLTITARNSILDTVERRLANRLYQLFHWEKPVIDNVVARVIQEASSLDGISLLSAINQKDNNINEFMAYVLTSIREKNKDSKSALRIIVHLDSYKHWFSNEDESSSRPDFLMLSVVPSDDILKLEATVIECKISSFNKAAGHIDKAKFQVTHGLEQLQRVFNPKSDSIERRYWFSQLYRALVFAQVTFSDNTEEFGDLSSKLRAVLDGKFSIEWKGEILGYWFDMQGDAEVKESSSDNITIYNIPQLKIQEILAGNEVAEFVQIVESDIASGNDEDELDESEDLESAARKELEEMNARSLKKHQILEQESNNGTIQETDQITNITSGDSKSSAENETVSATKEDNSSDSSSVTTNTPTDDMTDAKKPETKISEVPQLLESTRVKIGTDRTGSGIYWEFGNPQLANRHLLITGTSGQGKTYSIQTMLYEISKSDISTVIFDYTEGFRPDQLEKKFLEKMEDRIDNRVVYFSGVPINPFKRNEIEVAGMKAPEKIADVAQRIANILTHVYNFGEQQFAAVFDACRVGLEKHGSAMNMQILEKELNESSNKSAKSVVSKMAPFFHSVEFTGEEFDWKDVLYGDKGKVTIFQLTNFVRDIQVIITEFLLWDMWHYTKKYGSKDKPFVVVLDEAQNLSHTLSSPSGMILTEGRKFGWSAWYATQSLKILSEDEIVRLMQSAFKLYFKPTDEEIIAMAKQLNPSDVNEWRAPLTNLKKGQCIVVGSRIQKDNKFGIGRPTITNVTSFEERD
ncbi:MAG: ATP-binding protein [Bacillus sp. (in: firmicutes)]